MWVTAHPYNGEIIKITADEKNTVKKRLLDEAARQFSEKGFKDANINEIALGAGFAKGTIYNYFRSKEELFGGVIEEAARRTLEKYNPGSFRSVRESLKELVIADVSVLEEDESFVKVLVSEAMNPISGDNEAILEHLGDFIGTIVRILEEGLTRGEIRSDKPTMQLALVFLGLLTLLYVQHWKSGGAWPQFGEIPDLVVTLFLDGAGTMENGAK